MTTKHKTSYLGGLVDLLDKQGKNSIFPKASNGVEDNWAFRLTGQRIDDVRLHTNIDQKCDYCSVICILGCTQEQCATVWVVKHSARQGDR